MDFLNNFWLLFPQGTIALAERDLMLQATLFMLMVAVPVWGIAIFFAVHYRHSNTKAKYTPDWAHSNLEELIWWAIPLEIILVLGALTWGSTHELDPKRALTSEPPLVIEVVALNWKWLFIYPEQKIATVNYVEFPAGTPVRFDITADAPMNSFWIPSLAGQMYAMTGMVTNLNVMAPEPGRFEGRSANYSGIGFADMKFIAQADTQEKFDAWVASMQHHYPSLTAQAYEDLAKPATSTPASFGEVDHDLFDTIIGKFMSPYGTKAMR